MKEVHQPKSDLLFLLVGTNPFPNLISVLTRVKDDGHVYFFHTDNEDNSNTKIVFKNLEELLSARKLNCTFKPIPIDKSDVNKIEEKVKKTVKDFFQHQSNKLQQVELNYTGGTKVMAAGAYHAFKNLAHSQDKDRFILSYIDGEKEKIYYEVIETGKQTYSYETLDQLESKQNLSVGDIIQLHGIILGDVKGVEFYNIELAERFFQLFVNPTEEEYHRHIHFFVQILYDMGSIKINKSNKSKKEKLDENIHDQIINLNSSTFESEYNPFPEIHSYLDLTKDGKMSNQFRKYITGIWLEEYILKLVLELKEEDRTILDVYHSVEPVKESSKRFEVDIVLLKKYKLFSISVTMQETEEEAILKLYEVKERAKQLGGDESGFCLITLFPDSALLEKKYRNIWDNDSPKNTLIIGQDRFNNIKILLKNWIEGNRGTYES